MKKINNNIEIYENVVSDKLCQFFIDYFEEQDEIGNTFEGMLSNKKVKKETKNSKDCQISLYPYLGDPKLIHELDNLILTFNECSIKYHNKYFMYGAKKKMLEDWYLDSYDEDFLFQSYSYPIIKIGKYTPPDGGFHAFHEDWSGSNWDRHIVSMLYLNDNFEGGETEFLHQGIKVKPKKGNMLFFPPYYTHVHKGNKPIGNPKYIITLWYKFKSQTGNPPKDVGFYL